MNKKRSESRTLWCKWSFKKIRCTFLARFSSFPLWHFFLWIFSPLKLLKIVFQNVNKIWPPPSRMSRIFWMAPNLKELLALNIVPGCIPKNHKLPYFMLCMPDSKPGCKKHWIIGLTFAAFSSQSIRCIVFSTTAMTRKAWTRNFSWYLKSKKMKWVHAIEQGWPYFFCSRANLQKMDSTIFFSFCANKTLIWFSTFTSWRRKKTE